MSNEDDDIAWITIELKRLVHEAQSPDDLGVALINQLSSGYDDRVAMQQVESKFDASARARLIRSVNTSKSGKNVLDLVSDTFVAELENRREISKRQTRIISRYQIVRFTEDGRNLLDMPSPSSYFRAKCMMLVVSIAAGIAGVLAWVLFSASLAGFAVSWTLGYLLGWAARDIYDSAWGRARLAVAISSRHRWLCLSQ